MIAKYIKADLKRSNYLAVDNGFCMATANGFLGVIEANRTIERCREDLIKVIEDWINRSVTESLKSIIAAAALFAPNRLQIGKKLNLLELVVLH